MYNSVQPFRFESVFKKLVEHRSGDSTYHILVYYSGMSVKSKKQKRNETMTHSHESGWGMFIFLHELQF